MADAAIQPFYRCNIQNRNTAIAHIWLLLCIFKRMETFKVVIFIMAVLIALSAVADRTKLPYPILMVVAGLVIGFVPQLPDLALDPPVVFLIFLPPLLYDAASKTSVHEMRALIRPISALAISLVFFTTTAVAVTAHYLIAGFTWPLAFVLGAIISPPDAVAATSITKGLGLNKKVITILEGESLLNDASALIAYRYAIVAVTTGSFVLWQAGLQFLLVVLGGIAVGIVFGYLFVFAHKKTVNNFIVETSLTLLCPFVTYLAAEHVHVSGVLAVVCTGLIMSWRGPEVFTYQVRIRTRIVWDTLIYLLNGFIFILIGLQLPAVIHDTLIYYNIFNLLADGLWVSLATILVRIFWVFVGAYWQRVFRKRKKASHNHTDDSGTWKNVLIVAWTGTRGIISLATALALPLVTENGGAFPKRHAIIFLSFVVIFVTLVVQGLTLPLLIRILKVKPAAGDDEEAAIKLHLANATLDFIENDLPPEIDRTTRLQLKSRFEKQANDLTKEIRINKKKLANDEDIAEKTISPLLAAQREIARFQRELLIKMHKEGAFSDSALKKAELERDINDLTLDMQMPRQEEAL